MKKLKKATRFILFVLVVIVASFGLGFPLFVSRERYQEKDIRIELAEKKQDEEETGADQAKN